MMKKTIEIGEIPNQIINANKNKKEMMNSI